MPKPNARSSFPLRVNPAGVEIVSFRGKRYAVIPIEEYEDMSFVFSTPPAKH